MFEVMLLDHHIIGSDLGLLRHYWMIYPIIQESIKDIDDVDDVDDQMNL